MNESEVIEIVLESLEASWRSGIIFKNMSEYKDCIQQVKEKFNERNGDK